MSNRIQKTYKEIIYYDEHYHITVKTNTGETEKFHCNDYTTVVAILNHFIKPQEAMFRSINECRQSHKWMWWKE